MCANWGFVWIGYRNVHTFIPQICHCGLKQEKIKQSYLQIYYLKELSSCSIVLINVINRKILNYFGMHLALKFDRLNLNIYFNNRLKVCF